MEGAQTMGNAMQVASNLSKANFISTSSRRLRMGSPPSLFRYAVLSTHLFRIFSRACITKTPLSVFETQETLKGARDLSPRPQNYSQDAHNMSRIKLLLAG